MTSKAVSPSPELSEDRASSIGWYFINSYYDFYNNNIEAIYRIYQQSAAVSHAGFPSSAGRTIHKAVGIDAIKARFAQDDLKAGKNRIIITSAAFEVCLHKNILIVAFGEWSKNDSPYHQFTQTFLLTPGKKENTFDVANDVLRFVENEEYKEDEEKVEKEQPVKEKKEEKREEKKVTDEKKPEKRVEKKEEKVPAKEAEKEEKPEKKESEKVEKVEKKESEKKEEKVEKKESEKKESEKKEEKVEKKESEKPSEKPSEEPSEKESSDEPAAPISWAALASQSAPSKPVTPIKPSLPKPVKKPVAPPKSASKNGKGEGFHPIYMRGVGPLESEKVSAYLSKHFGPVKVFNKSDKIALVEFFTAEAQEKAISAKEGTIDGITFTLEPRESKNNFGYNGYKNGYAQGNFKKFKDVKGKFPAKKKGRE